VTYYEYDPIILTASMQTQPTLLKHNEGGRFLFLNSL